MDKSGVGGGAEGKVGDTTGPSMMMKKNKKQPCSTKVGGTEKKGVEGRVRASSGTARLLGDGRCELVINERRARWAAKRCGIRGHIAAGGPPLTGSHAAAAAAAALLGTTSAA